MEICQKKNFELYEELFNMLEHVEKPVLMILFRNFCGKCYKKNKKTWS